MWLRHQFFGVDMAIEVWFVLREDFSNNVFVMSDKDGPIQYESEKAAKAVAKEFNDKGHHQNYWVSQEIPPEALVI